MDRIRKESTAFVYDQIDANKIGDIIRNETRLKLWMRYELSAIKIQRLYRCWKFSTQFRNNIKRKILRKENKQVAYPTLLESFRSVANEEAKYEETMSLWRSAIEMRKAHNSHSTDLIIKAMVEAKGDLSRAITLMGTKEFVMTNQNDLNPKLRKIFLPVPSTRHRSVFNTGEEHRNSHNSRIYGSTGSSFTTVNSSAGNNIDLIRSLREKKRQSRKQELFDILEAVLAKSYFSKIHINSQSKKDVKKLQKVPSTTTIRAHHAQVSTAQLSNTIEMLATRSGQFDF